VATRRRYKSPPGYFRGGAVPSGAKIPDSAGAPQVEPAPIAPPVEAAPIEAPPVSSSPTFADDPLVRAHAAQLRAEELQRHAARAPSNAGRPPTIDDVVNAIPGLSEHKRAFLREHPNFLEPASADQVRFHYHSALAAGVADDTPEMNRAILDGVASERERSVDVARKIAATPPAAPRRPSIQFSAPVSREVPNASGKRHSDDMTLTPEERDIARRSIIDRPDLPRMTNAEKEWQYLQNRNRLRRMKADGSYSEQRE
jgi:hypothetical protein